MERWVMKQQWHDVFFLHWAVPAASLRPHVPEELELDLTEGSAWLGVVGFKMSGTRPRFLPSIPGTGTFLELNVRTYVKHGGRSGVFFLVWMRIALWLSKLHPLAGSCHTAMQESCRKKCAVSIISRVS